jgi:type IV pilus assembly protein PilW
MDGLFYARRNDIWSHFTVINNACGRNEIQSEQLNFMIWKNKKGFTLIELLVAMGLSLIVMGAVYGVYRVQAHTVRAQEFKMEAQEDARAALDMMTREIRNAGFFPTLTPCAAPANNNGIATATAASATTLRFVYDADRDGSCTGIYAGPAGADEDVTYSYTGTDITRAVGTGTPQLLTAGNVTAFSFTYFDSAGAPITVLANIAPLAKRISISLTVRSRGTDAQFGGGQLITMTSNVDLRNRCFSSCAQM